MQTIDISSPSPGQELQAVLSAVAKARRIVFVTGAGTSVQSGIPDFRSASGLFATLKERNPKAGLSSGKDLFSATLFQNEANTALFYNMIAELSQLSNEAPPSDFHHLMKTLDDQGKLHRVYTQNIDALEEKAGLTYGLGLTSENTSPRATLKRKLSRTPSLAPPSDLTSSQSSCRSPSPDVHVFPTSQSSQRSPTKKRSTIPKAVPLHGHLQTLACLKCSHSEPFAANSSHLATYSAGQGIPCPSCQNIESHRQATGERSRGVGIMKVSVVLYGDIDLSATGKGNTVGEITSKDLMGNPRPDLLIVAGTSLKVPGTKRLVKELAKVIKAGNGTGVKTIFANMDFPVGKEWHEVFDWWLKGDCQLLPGLVEGELEKVKEAQKVREERKVAAAKRKAEKEANGEGPVQKKQKVASAIALPVVKVKQEPQHRIKPSYEMQLQPSYNCFQDEPLVIEGKRKRKPSTRCEEPSAAIPLPSLQPKSVHRGSASIPLPVINRPTAAQQQKTLMGFMATSKGVRVGK